MTNFLKTTNFGCIDSTWVFMGMFPLSLLYLIRPFHKVNCWHKSKAPTCYVLQIMHHNIYGFSTSIGKLSLLTKKPQHIEVQLCGFQATTWVHIATSCYISTSTQFEGGTTKPTLVKPCIWL
jgi:hypothetical protein